MKKQLVMGASVAVGWLPIFWSTGLTWDDWVSRGASPSDLAHWTDQMGRLSTFWTFPLSNGLFDFFGPPSVRVVSILAMVLTSLMVFQIVSRTKFVTETEALFIGFFVGLLPLDTTRSMLTTSMYVWCLALFYIAWRLLLSPSTWKMLLALPALFLSFEMSSLLIFAIIPCLQIFLSEEIETQFKRLRVSLVAATAGAFWITKSLWFAPFGEYAGYNRVGGFGIITLLFGLFAIISLGFAVLRSDESLESQMSRASTFMAIGILILSLGLLPYAVVGNHAPFIGTGTRHYSASGLGSAMILVGVVRFVGILRKPLVTPGFRGVTMLLVLFVWLNCLLSLNYWKFQDAVQEYFRSTTFEADTLAVFHLDETATIRLSRILGPNFAMTWYVPTGLSDPFMAGASIAVMNEDVGDVQSGRISCCPVQQPWSPEPTWDLGSKVDIFMESRNGFLGLFPTYEIRASGLEDFKTLSVLKTD